MSPAPAAASAEMLPFMPLIGFIVSYGGGYLLGSIPFGLVLTKLSGLGDLRTIGSGNIGATNVLRTGKKGLAALTLLLDALKGAAAVMLGLYFAPFLGLVGGLAALLGHAYPIWLKYKGGKGVATGFGVTMALSPPLGLAAGFTWTVVLVMVRYSSLAALSAALMTPIYAWLFDRHDLVSFFVIAGAFVWWRHRENIKRLINGTEPTIIFGSRASSGVESKSEIGLADSSLLETEQESSEKPEQDHDAEPKIK